MNSAETDPLELVNDYLIDLQSRITSRIEEFEPSARFISDRWTRAEGGGGDTRVISDGELMERGGVNFSRISGDSLPAPATAARPQIAGQPFEAMGVSLVLHPNNPYVPTTHLNVRFFSTTGDDPIWWFGGGFDLTPYYANLEDVKHWHQTAKNRLDPIDAGLYPTFKKWCDEYFFLPHRGEARGIGGTFFDDLGPTETKASAGFSFEKCFEVMRAVGDGFLDAYIPIVEKRRNTPFGDRERAFQCMRRGRYVEFNLLYDRGTHFGLQSGGRTESILMSLPPETHWQYCYTPEPGSEEEKLTKDFLPARDWVDA